MQLEQLAAAVVGAATLATSSAVKKRTFGSVSSSFAPSFSRD